MAQSNPMDDFVNWDQAGAALDDTHHHPQAFNPSEVLDPNLDANLDLVLENVSEDDFSFHALQHFTSQTGQLSGFGLPSQEPTPLTSMPELPALQWETPDLPCAQCTLGGYTCKKIKEGVYQGFCTSCVALTIDCSFGGSLSQDLNSNTSDLGNNTWPSIQDFSIHETEHHVSEPLQPLSSASAMELFKLVNGPGENTDAKPPMAPKVGARLSRESVRVLKTWLSTHNRHPYPSDEEKEMLQRQTGLSKTQITNWLANARRRGKVQPQRSTSPVVGNWSNSIDVPHRRATPALESMNPLQRWQNSPPEHEPASVTAIARAVTTSSASAISSGLNSPFSFPYTDDGSGRSLCNQSSASSLGTSHSSNGSRGSAYSHGSRNSFGSFGSGPIPSRNRRRRRRRAAPRQSPDSKMHLTAPLKTFQCTFCTETFRTKHDWQRHEKSLHLSLERWVCAPEGARVLRPETGTMCCAFCGEADPSDEHIERHNHSTCQERTLEERTFYRKDHLNQHLRLVHDVKFADWSMKTWKVSSPEIRSRCGFCGQVLDTWTHRVDHLAEHFKSGYSMADWKGDWGFDAPVLAMVENSVPPYLIHHERLSPLPYIAGKGSPESPRNAYELIKLEMAYYAINYQQGNEELKPPTDEEMMQEACRIIFASETLSLQGIATQSSWLRDIIMSDEELATRAKFGPLRTATENRLASLKINGKDNLFEECPMENQLHEFVKARRLLGLTAMDNELQEEALKIIGRVEEISTNPSENVANWLVRLVKSSVKWLAPFRQRASLPRSDDIKHDIIRSTDPTSIDSTIHNYSRLERELADFLKAQRSMGVEPKDEDLQRQARIIIYEFDDGWNQTAADNLSWLHGFKNRHPPDEASPAGSGDSSYSHLRVSASNPPSWVGPLPTGQKGPGFFYPHLMSGEPIFLNNDNCYRRLERELGRYAASMMSPNNPTQHIPTDAELQHQARWILHNDDDTWNQTAADNVEWLTHFKRLVGILPSEPTAQNDYQAKLGTQGWSLGSGGFVTSNAIIEPVAPIARSANAFACMNNSNSMNSMNNINKDNTSSNLLGNLDLQAHMDESGLAQGDVALQDLDFDFTGAEGFGGASLQTMESMDGVQNTSGINLQ